MMKGNKQRYLVPLCLVVLLMTMASCSNDFEPKEITWEHISIEHIQPEDDPQAGISYKFDIELPSTRNRSIITSIRNRLMEIIFAHDLFDDTLAIKYDNLNATITSYISHEKSLILRMADPNDPFYFWRWEEHITLKPLEANPTFLVFELKSYTYTGGAHGNFGTKYITFDAETGRIVHYTDLWMPDSIITLNHLLSDKLFEYKQNDANLDDAEFWIEDLFATDNFRITSDSIYFTYNPYEIAAYCYGEHTIGISEEEAMPYLRKSSVAFCYWTNNK